MTLKPFIRKILNKDNLTQDEAKEAISILISGKENPLQIVAFLTSLSMKDLAEEEIVGFVQVMRSNMLSIQPKISSHLIDNCGTGGDSSGTFNISTVSSFVIAGAGVTVAKHGNKSISSKSGSSDVIQKLGVPINLSAEESLQNLDTHGIAFLFAPTFHPAAKNISHIRQELNFRTLFNLIGPLCNPANVKRQVIGVFDKKWLKPLGSVLKKLGSHHIILMHGHDGLDELSLTGPTDILELFPNGDIKEYTFKPQSLGLDLCSMDDLKGADPQENALIAKKILSGEQGAQRDVVCLNAAAAIYVGGKASSIKEGLSLARASIDSGAALEKLQRLSSL
ncbi:anthranilate phosphoribosyltransferase [PVC group bacterium (ex Bugula neritina AB1)]|nr:anthranilate phosphoribosyltransferase [PVC group bacterium (ex Bugula neritina AB1)]